ncbi:PH domain-containing protein [uncultured Enorma sp.]|uniref:PH domain-containing protein n=1 Tax=uncultured Enorma sp. TaxID=1714346 RepID=UPI0026DD3A37|nr:PH domain-containing protein [uncultured Enorma sp.]
MAGQDDKKRVHASEEAPARLESDCKTLPVGTPAAKAAHAAEKARSAGSNRTLEHLGREVERLANPRNSLFEEAGVPLSGVHRGSALSLITGAVSGLGVAFGVSLVAIVRTVGGNVAKDLPGVIAIASAIVALSVVSSVITWRTRTWELTDAGIMLRSGLVTSKQLQVPYEHIHTVNMSSNLVERVLGLMTLDLDTGAASSEGEATRIRGLQAGMAEALREELFRRKAAMLADQGLDARAAADASAEADDGASPTAPAPLPDACYTLTTAQLVFAALTEARVVAQAAAFLILIVQGINLLQESALVNLSDVAGDIAVLPVALLVGAVALLLALALVVGFAVSFVMSLIGFAGYRAERAGGRISVERGLLSRTSHTVALERIQSISIRQGIIRQLIGYAEVRASVVGAIGSSDETSTADGVVLHPFIRVTEIEAFLASIAPDFSAAETVETGRVCFDSSSEELEEIGLVRLPRAAARRLAFRTAMKSLALAVALAGVGVFLARVLLAGESWSMVRLAVGALLVVMGVAVVARMILSAVLRYRDSRIGHDRTRFVMVLGGVKRRTEVVLRARLQHATASASPFQRRVQVATFMTRTAATGDLALRDVSAADADALLAWIRPRRGAGAAKPVDAAASRKDSQEG